MVKTMNDSSKQAGRVFQTAAIFWQMQFRDREQMKLCGSDDRVVVKVGKWFDQLNRYKTEAAADEVWQRSEKFFHETPGWQYRMIKVIREAGRPAKVDVIHLQE